MSTKPNINNKAVTKPKSSEEIKDDLRRSKTGVDPDVVLQEAEKELNGSNGHKPDISLKGNLFKAMSLLEFESGILMATAIPEQYQTFGIDMLRQLQQEFNCETVSEKATAELVAINYIRTLDIERRISNFLNRDSYTDLGMRYLAVLSKELDRANRHYLTAIQVLRSLKQLPFQLTLKANTAVIGQNQLVQANSHE